MGKGDTQSNSRQLLPNVLKARAQQNPDGAWAQFPISEHTYADGLGTATNRQVFNAVNKVAWFLQKNLGPASNFETIAYLGPFDPRCFIVVIAGIKVGYKTFLPSPRNSKAAQLNLLSRLECTKIVTVDPQPPAVSAVLEENPFTVIQIPSLQELLSDDENNIPPEYPFEKSYEDAKDEPIFVLHTSGSTGFPKPLTYTHRFITRTVNLTSLPAPEGFSSGNDTIRTGHWFTFLAPFHISGIGFGLMVSAYNDCVPVYPLPSQPLSTAQFLDAVKHVKMDWAFVLPFILEDLSKDPAALDLVSQKLSHLYFAGGSVPKAAGDVVASKLPLYQTTGSSEVSLLSQVHSLKDGSVNKDKWMYINIHPALNIEYRHHHGDLYEMVIVRNKEDEELQPVFLHFPELQEYETRDLLTPHPSLPGLWRYRARKDDIIVFLNGEKTNPISFEQEVARHPEVRSAVVAGAQRFEACLIVEPHKNETLLSPEQRAELLERIWGNIEKANQECPAHARVSKENVIFTHPSKPFPRAAKGTVQRAAALLLYEEEIEKLYAEREAEDASTSKLALSEVDLTDSQAVSKAVENLVSEVTQWNSSFSTDTDFFSLGMDSLQVIRLSRQLNLPPSTIYMNPSVEMLTKAVTSPTSDSQDSEIVASTLDRYERAIDKIAADIAQLKHQYSPESVKIDGDAVVVLTGSTGAVGSYVLQKLLQNNKVAHVYCFNRVPDSQSLQHSRNTQRRIQCDLPSDRVSFLKANLAEENFGLDDAELYAKIQSTATHFIHNAWPVNFNQSLLSFRPSLDGVLGLVRFAAHAPRLVSTVFLSSVSAITNYSQTASAGKELVPEEIITDPKCPAGMGYGQSKYVSERILDYASKTLNLPNVRVARVGQIAGTSTAEQGPPHGWNRHEWLPSLVISSHYLKAIPESLGSKANGDDAGMLDRIDWVPIDQLAVLLVEIAFNININIEQNHAPQSHGAQVFHPTNPRFVSWQSLLPAVVDALTENSPSASTVKVLKYEDWLSLLRSTASLNTATKEEEANERVKSDSSTTRDDALTRNPAVKLLEFYESLAFQTEKANPLAFEHTAKICPSLQSLDAIKPEWLRGWIKDWVLGSSDE